VRRLLLDKIGGDLATADEEAKLYFLKTWCKFISMDYVPVLSECADVVSLHPHEKVTPSQSPQSLSAGGERGANSTAATASQPEQWLLEQLSLSPAIFNELKAMTSAGEEEETPPDVQEQQARLGNSRQQLLLTCTRYSATVLESVLLLTRNVMLRNNEAFVTNLQRLLQQYNVRAPPPLSLLSYYRLSLSLSLNLSHSISLSISLLLSLSLTPAFTELRGIFGSSRAHILSLSHPRLH
jgi:hypothetical protein